MKFIDPKTKKYKMIKFIQKDDNGVYLPEALQNPKVIQTIASDGKFLKRILQMMSFELAELY